jgi:hypothetical protein
VIFTKNENGALEPELWVKVKTLVDKLKVDFPGLHAAWPYEYLSQLSLAFTANDANPQAFPDSAELVAQYLLLFDERSVESYLDWNRANMAVMFQMPFRNSAEFRPFRDRVNAFLKENGLEGGVTGRMPVFFEAADAVSKSNIESILIGGVAIFALLLLAIRSLRVALIALAVNVLPVVGTLAFLGVFGVYLDVPMSFAAAIALGLVVDDTGHMVVRYDLLRRAGRSAEEAANAMVREYWRPVLFTSVTVIIGFSVMNFAYLTTYHTFSRMICVAMAYALIGDLVFLPALLRHFDRRTFQT